MCARQIVFVYDGDAKSNELVPDTDGKAIIPERGEIIERNGKRWTVVAIHTQTAVSGNSLPVVKVFLASTGAWYGSAGRA